MIEIMLPALIISLILVGLHAYLGIHIIARGVIFVDLALAQTAAMGWAAGNLGLSHWISGFSGIPEEAASTAVGVIATTLAAALFSMSRFENEYVPQEAIIGIVFVVASAGTIILAAQAPRGSEHVEQLLTGSLLWVTWPQIWRTLGIYAVIGAIHWALRHRFLTISLRPDQAEAQHWSIRLWDFLFYALFGVVVTISVGIAGVLVVFSFLVIPAVIAFLFAAQPKALLPLAWSSGILATLLGLFVSYKQDLPTGPVVVCAFAVTLVTAFGIRAVRKRMAATPAPAPAKAP